MRPDAECAERESTAPAQRGNQSGLAWPDSSEPTAPQRGCQAERDDKLRKRDSKRGLGPVAACAGQQVENSGVGTGLRFGDPQRLGQRRQEHAETVRHTNTQMDAKCRRRNHPAVETRAGDGALLVEKTCCSNG